MQGTDCNTLESTTLSAERERLIDAYLDDVFSKARKLLCTQDDHLYVDVIGNSPSGVVLNLRLLVSYEELRPGEETDTTRHIRTYTNTQNVVKDSVYSEVANRPTLPDGSRVKLDSYSSELSIHAINHRDDNTSSVTVDALFTLVLHIK